MSARSLSESALRVSDCVTELLRKQPFFGSLVLRLPLRPDATRETLATDGHEIRYSPRWVAETDSHVIETAMARVVMACALKHHTRRGERDPERWQIASQLVTHALIRDAGFTLPPDAEAWEDLTVEQAYDRLPEPGDDDSGDEGDPSSETELDLSERSAEKVSYHVMRLADAGLIDAVRSPPGRRRKPPRPWPCPSVVRGDQVQDEIAVGRFHWDLPLRFGKRAELVAIAAEQFRAKTPFRRFREKWTTGGNADGPLPYSSRLAAVVPPTGCFQHIDFVLREQERRVEPSSGVADKRAMFVDRLGRGAKPSQIAFSGLERWIGTAEVARLAAQVRVERLVHISGIGAIAMLVVTSPAANGPPSNPKHRGFHRRAAAVLLAALGLLLWAAALPGTHGAALAQETQTRGVEVRKR